MKYSFENFIYNNSSVKTAVDALVLGTVVCLSDQNPIFICGTAGTGKTHLIQAAAERFRSQNPWSSVLSTNGHEMVVDMIDHIFHTKFDSYIPRYMAYRMLLIDDLEDAVEQQDSLTERALIEIINERKTQRKQTVIASEKSIDELGCSKELKELLRSSFVVRLEPANENCRRRLAEYAANDQGLELGDASLDLIARRTKKAEQVNTIIREVSGYHKLMDMEPSLENVTKIVDDLMNHFRYEPERVIAHTCLYYGLKEDALSSKACPRGVGQARLAAAYILSKFSYMNIFEIAHQTRKSDYTFLHRTIKKIDRMMADEQESPLKNAILGILDSLSINDDLDYK